MARKQKKAQDYQSKRTMKQFQSMMKNLHQMLKFLGQQQSGTTTIKIDQFQRLRQSFTKSASEYQKSNIALKKQSDKMQTAKLVFKLSQNKLNMEQCLKQMTTITIKLKEKFNKEKGITNKLQTPKKKKNDFQSSNQLIQDELGQQSNQKSPLQREIQYKNLTIYHLQNAFFRLIKTQRKEVANVKRDLNNKKFNSLDDMKNQAKGKRLLDEQQDEQNDELQQKQMLQALKYIDDMIQQKMDTILEGINIINRNAITISEGLDDIHRKIIINLQKTDNNLIQLKANQHKLQQASKHLTKPSCICNVILLLIVLFIAYLIIRQFA